ncbi:MAG: GNAT family N-acetyltransferase [Paraglaciecola sp.]|uniref:GNAT family N-acetyltransferase n=1 Tax=Paraglaciecola sp. TaxID=1920173 RepID=UPI0032668CAC
MKRFEYCNAKSCFQELLALGQHNMKMWYLFTWLAEHGELQHGTQAEIIKLYVDNELVAYSLFENYQARLDKLTFYGEQGYQDLGVVHFVTLPSYRNQGFASTLADKMYQDVIQPLLVLPTLNNVYVTATGKAVPLMQRAGIAPKHLITQFYSELSFKQKVVDAITQS